MRAICPSDRGANMTRADPPCVMLHCGTLLDNLDVLLHDGRSFGNPIANRGVMEVVDRNHIEKVILFRSNSRLSTLSRMVVYLHCCNFFILLIPIIEYVSIELLF